MIQSACERGTKRVAFGMVFLKGGQLLSTTDFLRLQVPPTMNFYLLQWWKEQRECQGICSDCHSRQLSALFVEKRVMVQSTVPLLQVWWHAFLLRGQAKLHSDAWFASGTQWRKCSWFRIWYYSIPPNPISRKNLAFFLGRQTIHC